MFMLSAHLLFPAVFALATPDAAAKPSAALVALVDEVQKRYDKTSDLTARFTQTLRRKAYGNRVTTRTGTLRIKKPGKMRFDYETPSKEMWLASGTSMVVYQPEDKQAFRQDLSRVQIPAALSFVMGKGRLVDEFEIKQVKPSEVPGGAVPATTTDPVWALRPKKAAGGTIHFVVDPQTHLIKQTVLLDEQGNVNSFAFTNMVTNTKVGADVFEWKPPAGLVVRDLAAPQTAPPPKR